MRQQAVILSSLIALGVLCISAAQAVPPAVHVAVKEEVVYKIDSVSATIKNHRLIIHATGAVRSGGWQAPKLRVQTLVPAGEHTLVVEFMAVPPAPDAAVIQALLPVAASVTARLRRVGIGSVRVVSQTNEITTQILP